MKNVFIALSAIVVLLSGCKEDWDEHYNTPPETVDKNMWEVVKANPELSSFVQYMEAYDYDTLFDKNATYTLFIPDNSAFEEFLITDSITETLLSNLISIHFVQSGNITGADKIQMLAEKYVLFEHYNNTSLFDGIPLEFESPLYRNGKYFVMPKVSKPKPNLFEYFAFTNPILKTYILDLDSIIVDKEKSRPIDFNEEGKTIYDTVAIIYNEFEELYFPVREEFRNKTATIVFPKAEDYNSALDEMANVMGDAYQDHTEIPLAWQNDVLIPYLLEHGVFENVLGEVDFIKTGAPKDTLKLKNILGDSIAIEYQVTDKVLCSNGVAFNYKNFAIPDTLYNGITRIEAEWYVIETGINKFSWRKNITTVSSTKTMVPIADSIPTASNDSILRVMFGPGYTGTFSLEMKIDNLFPRKYLMKVRTHKNFGGIYDVYLNDQLIRTMDYYDYFKTDYRWYYYSVTGKRYFYDPATPGYAFWDAWADNDRPYGEATLRFEYKGLSQFVPNPALLIDMIEFIPYD